MIALKVNYLLLVTQINAFNEVILPNNWFFMDISFTFIILIIFAILI